MLLVPHIFLSLARDLQSWMQIIAYKVLPSFKAQQLRFWYTIKA